MKVENEVKMRDEQRRNCEITFKKFDANGNGKLEPIGIVVIVRVRVRVMMRVIVRVSVIIIMYH